jgi:hypothetical protein
MSLRLNDYRLDGLLSFEITHRICLTFQLSSPLSRLHKQSSGVHIWLCARLNLYNKRNLFAVNVISYEMLLVAPVL